MFFKQLENTLVLVNNKGGLTPYPVAERNGSAYVKIGSSYHMLTSTGAIHGKAHMNWMEFAGDHAAALRKDGYAVSVAENVVQIRRAA